MHGKLDGHQEAALGVLVHAQKVLHLSLPEFEHWHEELQQWDEALAGYERRLATNPRDTKAIMGQMRCQKALSRWEQLLELGIQHTQHMQQFDAEEVGTCLLAACVCCDIVSAAWPCVCVVTLYLRHGRVCVCCDIVSAADC